MQIVDSQIHLWTSGTPGGTHQKLPYTMDDALAAMDAAGVDASVVVPPPWDVDANAVALEAARRRPGRFAVVGNLAAGDPTGPAQLATWTDRPGMLGARVAFSAPKDRALLEGDALDSLWSAAAAAKLPLMVFAPGSLPAIEAVARRHPELPIALDHMGLVTGTTDDAAFAPVLAQLAALARHPNVAIKLSSAPIYSSEPYPYRNIAGHLHEIFAAFGPARCFWGTDITRLSCSWRQCVTHFTEELPWLTGADQELVMGQAVCNWLGWDRAPGPDQGAGTS
ncbi:MAG TPA: amidohydrolase family protein [Baekduia sp.]|nr:amidohydrolase family protein [Baekduia sp.]